MSDVPEALNREMVVRLVLHAAPPGADMWALAHDVVRALDRWSSIPPEEIEERIALLRLLASGQDY